jgi:hypothetical protein
MATPKTDPTPPALTPAEILADLGVPTSARNQPAMDRAVPKRLVQKSEAEARGWSWYWDTSTCRAGHQAAKRTSNPAICSDCENSRKGKPTIYPVAKNQEFRAAPKPKTQPSGLPFVVAASAPPAPEPDAADKRFLTALAEHRNFEKAAKAVGTTVPLVQARISCNKVFADAVADMVERMAIFRPVQVSGKFKWTQELREILVTTYVDTGELATAREAIGCTASQFYRHLEENSAFAAAIDEAAPLAARAIEDVALKLARGGNDKLLAAVLKAKLPAEYGEKLRLDVANVTKNLSHEQLAAKVAEQLQWLQENGALRVIEGEIIEAPAVLPAPTDADCDLI